MPSQDEISSKLAESDITFAISSVGIAIPTILGSLNPEGLASIAGGVVSLISLLVCSLFSDRKYIKKHPFGYLYYARKRFGVNQ